MRRTVAAIRPTTAAPTPMPAFAPVERPCDDTAVVVGAGEDVWSAATPVPVELVGDEVKEDFVLGFVP